MWNCLVWLCAGDASQHYRATRLYIQDVNKCNGHRIAKIYSVLELALSKFTDAGTAGSNCTLLGTVYWTSLVSFSVHLTRINYALNLVTFAVVPYFALENFELVSFIIFT